MCVHQAIPGDVVHTVRTTPSINTVDNAYTAWSTEVDKQLGKSPSNSMEALAKSAFPFHSYNLIATII